MGFFDIFKKKELPKVEQLQPARPKAQRQAINGNVLKNRNTEATHCNVALAAPNTIWQIGQTIDGLYKILDVSAGGMGAVYFVNHLKWKIPLAVKTPLQSLIKSPSAYQRYIKEAETWINIGMHPHIVTCFYVRDIDGILRIFIEYVDGGTLKDLIDARQLADINRVLDLAIQFSMAMEYVHDQGIIHRDIKPANCMITGEGELKVTDFGIAKLGDDVPDSGEPLDVVSNHAGLTVTGTGFGTPEYMAPEQFLDAKNISKEADIYSFGVMLYEMVCGVRPFVMPAGIHSSARQYFYFTAHSKELPRPPIEINKQISTSLNNLILTCLEKDTSKRFRNFYDVSRGLQHCCTEIGKQNHRAKPDVLKLKADSLNNKAVSFLDLGKFDDAVRSWKEALDKDPLHLESTFNYGYYQWGEGALYQNVLKGHMANLVNTYGNRPDFWCLHAWLCYEVGDLEALEKIQNSGHRVVDPQFLKLCDELNTQNGRWVRVYKGHSIRAVAFSPSGNAVITSCGDNALRLWDVLSGKVLRCFKGHSSIARSVAYSSDGNYVLSGSDDKTIRLWSITTGEELRRFEGHAGYVLSVAFSPSGQLILSSSADSTIKLWDVTTGKEVRSFDEHDGDVTSVAFSPDAKHILSGSWDHTVRLWDISTGKEIRRLEGHKGYVLSVDCSVEGRYVISGSWGGSSSNDNTVRLWDVLTGREIKRFESHLSAVNCVRFSPNGKYILSGSNDRTVRVWVTATGEEIQRFEGHSSSVNSVAFSPNGRYVLSGSSDNTFRLCSWESIIKASDIGLYPALSHIKQPTELFFESAAATELLAVATHCISSDLFKEAYIAIRQIQQIDGFKNDEEINDLIELCAVKGSGKKCNFRSAAHISTFNGHSSSVNSIACSPDGKFIISGSGSLDGSDNTLRLWEIKGRKELMRFSGHSDIVSSVAFSPDGRCVLSGSGDNTLKLWDITTGSEIMVFEGHTKGVNSVAFFPDSKYVLSGSWDNTIRLWDIYTGKEIKRFEGHSKGVRYVAFSPNGSYALSHGVWDNTLIIWKVVTGEKYTQIVANSDGMISVAFSFDGSRVLSANRDKTLTLWDVSSGEEMIRFEGHNDSIDSVAFSYDGNHVISGSNDRTLRLWDVSSGKELKCFKGHNSSINAVAFSPDGRYIISAGFDRTIMLWELDWDWEFS